MENNNSEYELVTVYDWKDKNQNYIKPAYIIKHTNCFWYVVFVKSELIASYPDNEEEHQWLFYEPIDIKKAFRIKKDKIVCFGYKENQRGRNIFYIKTT